LSDGRVFFSVIFPGAQGQGGFGATQGAPPPRGKVPNGILAGRQKKTARLFKNPKAIQGGILVGPQPVRGGTLWASGAPKFTADPQSRAKASAKETRARGKRFRLPGGKTGVFCRLWLRRGRSTVRPSRQFHCHSRGGPKSAGGPGRSHSRVRRRVSAFLERSCGGNPDWVCIWHSHRSLFIDSLCGS